MAALDDDLDDHPDDPASFRFETSTDGGGAVRVAVFGELDAATAPMLDAALQACAGPEVVVDCGGLAFIDSSGLSMLVANHRRLSMAGTGLVLERVPVLARRLFEISGLDRVLTIR